jgi:hypothetical protein
MEPQKWGGLSPQWGCWATNKDRGGQWTETGEMSQSGSETRAGSFIFACALKRALLSTHPPIPLSHWFTNVPKIQKPFQNSRRQKGDMRQTPYWESTSIRRHHTKFSRPDDLAHGILHPCPIHLSSKRCRTSFGKEYKADGMWSLELTSISFRG